MLLPVCRIDAMGYALIERLLEWTSTNIKYDQLKIKRGFQKLFSHFKKKEMNMVKKADKN